MSRVVLPQLLSLLTGKLFRYATCWRIKRLDGTIFRFTEHNALLKVLVDTSLLYQAGDPYESFKSATGVSASAREAAGQLEPSNFEARGMVTSDEIKDIDLKAGLFDGAEVQEILVDWRYPWLGPFYRTYFEISYPEFTGEYWVAHCESLTSILKAPAGDVYTRQGRLKKTPVHTKTSEVVTILTQRRIFKTQAGTLEMVENAYRYGTITWTSGANNGTKSSVRSFADVGGGAPAQFELMLETPNDIGSGDDFTVTKIEYEGGFPDLPGTDATRVTPPPQNLG